MTYMNEENPSKKKYLVPLVVLLLCGVAMTGAAFAYSSSMNTGGDVDVHSFEISTDKDKTTATFTIDSLDFNTVVTEKGVEYNNAVEKITFYMRNGVNTSGMTVTVTPTLDGKAAELLKVTPTYKDNGTSVVEVTLTFSAQDGKTIDYVTLNTIKKVTVTLEVTADGVPATQ